MSENNPHEPDPKASASQQRESQDMTEEEARLVYRALMASVVVVLSIGTTVYHFLEDWSWVDSFYFSAVAVTTVGFGDFTPTTDASKLFTVAYIFSGIAIITTYINVTLKRRGKRRIGRRRSRREHHES